MTPNSIKDKLYYCTVMIETAQGTGTAFFISKTIANLSRIYLVTNKHVVKDKTECCIRFHKSESISPNKKVGDFVYRFTDNEWETGWKFHDDEDVDLAVFNLTETMAYLCHQEEYIFFRHIPIEVIATKEKAREVPAMERIFFIGYPCAIRDNVNNLPIARSGFLATPLYSDFEGKEAFLFDATVFEGSSGSPIFIINESHEAYYDTTGNVNFNERIILAGVNAQSYTRVDDKQYLDIGYAWKAHKILEIIEQNVL